MVIFCFLFVSFFPPSKSLEGRFGESFPFASLASRFPFGRISPVSGKALSFERPVLLAFPFWNGFVMAGTLTKLCLKRPVLAVSPALKRPVTLYGLSFETACPVGTGCPLNRPVPLLRTVL